MENDKLEPAKKKSCRCGAMLVIFILVTVAAAAALIWQYYRQ